MTLNKKIAKLKTLPNFTPVNVIKVLQKLLIDGIVYHENNKVYILHNNSRCPGNRPPSFNSLKLRNESWQLSGYEASIVDIEFINQEQEIILW